MDPAIYVDIIPKSRYSVMAQINQAIGIARGRNLCPTVIIIERMWFDKFFDQIALQARSCPEIKLGDGNVIMHRGFPIMWIEVI